MEIANPRRILVVTLESEANLLSGFIKDLTGTHPAPGSVPAGDGPGDSAGSLAGTTHSLALKTAYYSAEVPVWLDTPAAAADWADSFLSPEAREVLAVLGGVVVVFPLTGAPGADDHQTASRKLVSSVGRVVREGLGGWDWDGVGLAVGIGEVAGTVPSSAASSAGQSVDVLGDWEELCGEAGLEFVHVRPGASDAGKNEFGEKTGIPRVLEALQSNDWALDTDPALDDDLDASDSQDDGSSEEFSDFAAAPSDGNNKRRRKSTDLNPESLGFGFDRADFEGLRRAIWSSGLDDDSGGSGGPEGETNRPDLSSLKTQQKDTTNKKNDSTVEAQAPTAAASSSLTDAQGSREGDRGNSGDRDETDELGQDDVEKVEAMMRKLLAVREMGAGMPEEQRRRMAARAVGEVMKEL